jgi:hypothetical protein
MPQIWKRPTLPGWTARRRRAGVAEQLARQFPELPAER